MAREHFCLAATISAATMVEVPVVPAQVWNLADSTQKVSLNESVLSFNALIGCVSSKLGSQNFFPRSKIDVSLKSDFSGKFRLTSSQN